MPLHPPFPNNRISKSPNIPSALKTLLILVDGMRPDAIEKLNHPVLAKLKAHSRYTLKAQTVMPSVTLPCHMSLFHGVDPGRHGTTTNVYAPQVRPVNGLCEVLDAAGQRCAFFYTWPELRDLVRPGSLIYQENIRAGWYPPEEPRNGRTTYEESGPILTDHALAYAAENKPEFIFLYLGWPDEAGHSCGWMSDEYLRAVRLSLDCIEKALNTVGDEYALVVTADHGGHDRMHGCDIPEDMTIPVFVHHPSFESYELPSASIIDLTKTIAALNGVAPDPVWEGKSLV